MKTFIKKNSILMFLLFVVILGIVFPDIKIETTGGFAWFQLLIDLFFGFSFIYASTFGGELSVSSEGLIPQLKRLFKKQ